MRTLLCTLITVFAAATANAAPPNVVFILSDDQRPDTISAHGNPHIDTPALDALVARGTSFSRAYCMGAMQGAVCIPSRAMMLTGQSLLEQQWTTCRDRDDIVLMPQLFREAGYDTFVSGKWHSGEPWLRRGFEEWNSVLLGGMASHFTAKVWDKAGDDKIEHELASFSSKQFADACLEWLETRDDDTPFFLHLTFSAPHDPRTAPEGWETRYDPASIPLPPNFLPVHPFDNFSMRLRDEELSPWPRTEGEIQKQLAIYYAMITHMDEQIGRVVDAVDALETDRDTIIVFAADHGLAVGSHGLLGKQSLYEHSMRAPLIIVGPGFPAAERCDAFTYLHDIPTTLCHAAGLAPPPDADGLNLADAVTDPDAWPRERMILVYGPYHQRSIRDGRWKLIRYPRLGRTQLFDLELDPHETTDLAGDPAYAERIDLLMQILAAELAAMGDTQPLVVDDVVDGTFDHEEAERVRLTKDHWKRR